MLSKIPALVSQGNDGYLFASLQIQAVWISLAYEKQGTCTGEK